MKQYLDLLTHVLQNGTRKETRGVLTSTQKHVSAISCFGHQVRFNLQQGFPLVTTKYVHFASIVHELVWFLNGDTNIAYLNRHKVKIWNEWADSSVELGPIYGKQWRWWQSHDGTDIDQISNVIKDIKTVKANPNAPEGRRLIVTAWNPADMPVKAPPACHTMFQFYVVDGKLSCHLYQRSADLFLGVPFNIASYALLTHLIAKETELEPFEFIHSFGDIHIYENHIPQVTEQLQRQPYALPTVAITGTCDTSNLMAYQIKLNNYVHHSALKGEIAI